MKAGWKAHKPLCIAAASSASTEFRPAIPRYIYIYIYNELGVLKPQSFADIAVL